MQQIPCESQITACINHHYVPYIDIYLFSKKIDVYRHQHKSDLQLWTAASPRSVPTQILTDKPFAPPANCEFETPSVYQVAIERAKRLRVSLPGSNPVIRVDPPTADHSDHDCPVSIVFCDERTPGSQMEDFRPRCIRPRPISDGSELCVDGSPKIYKRVGVCLPVSSAAAQPTPDLLFRLQNLWPGATVISSSSRQFLSSCSLRPFSPSSHSVLSPSAP